MAKPFEISDNYGWTWLVFEGDPAWAYCQRLAKNYVTQVVLPRQTVETGVLTSIKVPQVEPSDLTDDLKPLILRLVRCYDCVAWLNKSDLDKT